MSIPGGQHYTEEHRPQPPQPPRQEHQYFGGAERMGPQWSRGRGGGHRHGKPFFMTSEFLVLLATIAAVVIAAAVADGFGAERAWTLVTILAAAYIVSRGLSKAGHDHDGAD